MLGVQPALGRLFTKQDDSPGGAETVDPDGRLLAVAGSAATRRSIGRRIMLDGKPREIIGVLPDTFRFLDREASLDPAAAARSQQGVPRPVQLHRRSRG